MSQPLVDRLWRDHPAAPAGGRRGPRARIPTGAVVESAVRLADAGGLVAVTVRAVGESLGLTPMSVYTHVSSRADLLVLMVDLVHARMDLPAFGRASWRVRVRRVADANLALLRAHPWLLDVDDDRSALGPGTIAKYDHELHAFDGMGVDDVTRDAALTFLLDFVRAAARSFGDAPSAAAQTWALSGPRLAEYVGEDYPLASRVGAAAGAAMDAPHSADHAWRFGLDRVLAGLAGLDRDA